MKFVMRLVAAAIIMCGSCSGEEAREPVSPRLDLEAASMFSTREEPEEELTDEDRAARIREELGITERTPEEQADFDARYEAHRKARQAKRARERILRMFRWESPPETRARLWNVDREEQENSVTEALLRICISEADGWENDCRLIWRTINNIRNTKCNRGMVRRITECDENGETILSAMRRAAGVAVGNIPPRTKRQRWVSNLALTCERPQHFPASDRIWVRQYGERCPATAKLVKQLVSAGDTSTISIGGARPIAWGGRCETKQGACDDPVACIRKLARIPTSSCRDRPRSEECTFNAFWCRPGSPGCAASVDPICQQYVASLPEHLRGDDS